MGSSVTLFRWDDMPKEKVTDVIDRRLVTGERVMLASPVALVLLEDRGVGVTGTTVNGASGERASW